MRSWKQLTFSVVFLLVCGLFTVNAQDLIILKDGNTVEAKIIEISPTEIRYKHFDNLDGPMIVIPTANVLSIRYENGRTDIINAATPTAESIKTDKSQSSAIDPNKFVFAFNINPSGAIVPSNLSGGSSVCLEFGKRNFNTEINLFFPSLSVWGAEAGFGGIATFNYFWHSQIGGFYLGGGLGYIYFKNTSYESLYYKYEQRYGEVFYENKTYTFGLNIGYKFVTKSGVYFRTGTYIGMSIIYEYARTEFDSGLTFNLPESGSSYFYDSKRSTNPFVYLKPDLTIGYAFK